jgi:hypothetical protein
MVTSVNTPFNVTTKETIEPIDDTFAEMGIMKSRSIGQLALALAKAQGAIKGAVKDASNPFFKSHYADLESVWGVCRDPLAKNELAVIQIPCGNGEGVSVVTFLVHSSGEFIAGELPLNPKANDPQGIGSAITYGRRYALAAFAGVYQIDDDAEAAMDREQKQPKRDMETMGQKNPEAFIGVVKSTVVSNDTVYAIFEDRACKASTEPNRSKLLETEGMKLEMTLIPTKSKTKLGLPIYTAHSVAHLEAAHA